MKRQDFYYELPEELIAQDPLEDRSSSRLLVLDKETGAFSHHVFKEITEYLHEGDCLVINDTKVIPARLIGSKVETNAKIEVLLLKRKENNVWETLVKPGKKAKVGAKISFGDGLLMGEVIDVVEEGNRLIKFDFDGIFEEILDVTRRYMQLTQVRQQHRRQDCILHRNFWKRLRQKVWILRELHFMWGLEHSVR